MTSQDAPEEKDEKDIFTGMVWDVPSDVHYYRTEGGKLMLVIKVTPFRRDQPMFLVYGVPKDNEEDFNLDKAQKEGRNWVEQIPDKRVIQGGPATELTTIPKGMQVGDWFTKTTREYLGYNPVVEQDLQMAQIYTEALLEGWSAEQIQSVVTTTKWWKNASQEQQQYQLMSPEQKQEAQEATAGQLSQVYLNEMGQAIKPSNRYIKNLSRQVASAEISYAEAQFKIQTLARKDPNTPYSARLREFSRRTQNIENKIGELRGKAHEWGVDMNDDRLERWARRIQDVAVKPGKAAAWSDEDFDIMVKGLAEAQWGSAEAGTSHRQRDTSVDEWAAPYMSSFVQLMERGNAATTDLLFDRQFRNMFADKTMTTGDFEDVIRKSGAWLETNNGKRAVNETMSTVGSIFGMA